MDSLTEKVKQINTDLLKQLRIGVQIDTLRQMGMTDTQIAAYLPLWNTIVNEPKECELSILSTHHGSIDCPNLGKFWCEVYQNGDKFDFLLCADCLFTLQDDGYEVVVKKEVSK